MNINEFKPFICVLAGLPLVGKTTLGNEISKVSNIVYLDVDVARHSLRNIKDSSKYEYNVDDEASIMLEAYKLNHKLAKDKLESGLPVCLGATYSKAIYRKEIQSVANSSDYDLVYILLEVADDIIKERLKIRNKKGDVSNITTFEQYISVRDRYQPLIGDNIHRLNSKFETSKNIEKIFNILSNWKTN